jgi:hypothetical protein
MLGRAALLTLLVAAPAAAQPPADQTTALSALLRDLLLTNLPTPLVESKRNWGQQKPAPGKVLRRREGQPLNEGHWQATRVQAVDPAKSLVLAIGDLAHPEPGKSTFNAYLGLDVRLTVENQLWKRGVRLYGGETRARCRAALKLACEVTDKLETKPESLLPDLVFRVRVTNAELNYTDLVCEHTAGLDGPAAAKLGELMHDLIKQAKPNLERDLLAKANAAVVKAADTKEVRVAFDRVLTGKPPAVTRTGK